VKEWGKASIYGDNYTPLSLCSYVSAAFPLFGVYRCWKHFPVCATFNTTYGAAGTTADKKKDIHIDAHASQPHTHRTCFEVKREMSMTDVVRNVADITRFKYALF